MSILPQSDIDINLVINQSIDENKDTISKEYGWDFENNCFKLIDGKFVIVEGVEALKIWIWKALHTMKMTYSIYSDNYGHDLDTLIGQGYSSELIESEAKRLVWNCLKANPHIIGIENFSAIGNDDNIHIEFKAITDQGEVKIVA